MRCCNWQQLSSSIACRQPAPATAATAAVAVQLQQIFRRRSSSSSSTSTSRSTSTSSSSSSLGSDQRKQRLPSLRLAVLQPPVRCPLPGQVGLSDDMHQLLSSSAAAAAAPPFVLPSTVRPAVAALPPCRHSERSRTVREAFNTVEENFPLRDYPAAGAQLMLEYRLNQCPQVLKQQLRDLFPKHRLDSVTIVTVRTQAAVDRALLEETLLAAASEICQALRQEGYWSDFIDPQSGRPFLAHQQPATAAAAAAAATATAAADTGSSNDVAMGFEIFDLGCCKLILQRTAASALPYIGCLFTDAPPDHPLLLNLIVRRQ